MGEGGITAREVEHLEEISTHISSTERRSALAERDANDRYTALYLSEHVGASFTGRVSGVTRFGMFIALDETGADGLVPMRRWPTGYGTRRVGLLQAVVWTLPVVWLFTFRLVYRLLLLQRCSGAVSNPLSLLAPTTLA